MRAFGGKYSGKQSLKLLVFEAKLIELESFPIAFNPTIKMIAHTA
jgi:hypothetical protein